MKRPIRSYSIWLLGALAGALAASGVLTSLVDPWGVVNAPWQLKALAPYREIGDAVRVGKAGMVRRDCDWEAAIFGTSHMEIGINPRHPAFGGMKVVNLGMAGSGIFENVTFCRYLMARDPHLKLVIFGVDPADLCTDLDTRINTDFPNSRLADAGFSIEREISYVFGGSAVEASFVTVASALHGKKSERDDLGFWNNFQIVPDIRRHVTGYATKLFKNEAIMWGWRPQHPKPEKVAALGALISDLRSRGVRVLIVYPPAHSLMQLHPSEDAPSVAAWEADRRGLASLCDEANKKILAGPLVEFWDFFAPAAPTDEALPDLKAADQRFPRWFDLLHFNADVGDRMVDRMLTRQADPADETQFGVRVSGENIEAHLRAIREEHRMYCQMHADDVTWARALLRQVIQTVK